MDTRVSATELVIEIGCKALGALRRSGGQAWPVAGFQRSGYLLAAEEIIWVGGQNYPMHPRAVIVDKLQAPTDGLRRFEFAHCHPWRPEQAPKIAFPLKGGARMLRRAMAHLGNPRGFGQLLFREKPDFPIDLGAGYARALAAAYARSEPDAVIEASLPLLGFGSGLTPSGDDFVGASIFGRRRLTEPVEAKAEVWRNVADTLTIAAKSRSHVIGEALFSDLAYGQSFAPLHHLAEALEAESPLSDVVNAVRKLVGVGHSSGWDMLAGFVAGITGSLISSSSE